jgi:hypothetical protein
MIKNVRNNIEQGTRNSEYRPGVNTSKFNIPFSLFDIPWFPLYG